MNGKTNSTLSAPGRFHRRQQDQVDGKRSIGQVPDPAVPPCASHRPVRRAAAARFCVSVAATAVSVAIRCCRVASFERGDILRGGGYFKLLLGGLPVSLQLIGTMCAVCAQD